MKILVTGFDPFDNEPLNPAYEAVKALPDTILNATIIKMEIPTSFKRSRDYIEKAIKEIAPDVVLAVGQAGGRNSVSVEKVAINLWEARIPDNDGHQPLDCAIREDGDDAYFSNLPVKGMVAHLKENGVPASVSYTAGTFVCNSLMYDILYLVNKQYKNIKGGFIHVPYLPSQASSKNPVPSSMTAELIAKGIELAVEAIVLDKKGDNLISGETH